MDGYFTESFMLARKQDFVNSLGGMMLNIGTKELPVWTSGEILKSTVDSEGVMIFQCAFIDTVEIECSVCQIKLLDKNFDTAAIMDKEITTAYGQGVYVTVKIRMTETEWEVV